MRQPRKKASPGTSGVKPVKRGKTADKRMPRRSSPAKPRREHQKFGTSRLEQDFARDFLDKLGVDYIWQFEAREIKRFFDYYLVNQNLIIEVNGTYWHGDSRIYEEKELNGTQRKNQRVDEYKRKWALAHGIPVIYVWEKDIRENPGKVMEFLRSRISVEGEKMRKLDEKNKRRHINNINDKGGKKK